MGGGAWPFLVGGLHCLVNSDNERDLCLLTSLENALCFNLINLAISWLDGGDQHCCRLLRGTICIQQK